ncbi:MAG: UDP-3-O-[3-hydroxymyristoyl] glucosamine N-acyltransferase [Verrucomicrobiota bacterium]|jgi:UDP-3-O-[3-hydroxymyristoyl] glucosamine N-acyltransferase
MTFTTADIAAHVSGEVLGDRALPLAGFAPADTARAGDLTFAENEAWFLRAEQGAASAILVPGAFTSQRKTLIRVANARVAFAKVLPLFFPDRKFAPGIHPSAVIAETAEVDPSAHIGPLCVVDERARIGPRCVLEAGNYVGCDCRLGDDTHLFPNVTLYANTQVGQRVRLHAGSVIGADGFGYVFDQGRHLKVPQIGSVVLGDDVEIGANTTIDRGALGPTVIGTGTKIDNLVQIAHNVTMGDHCIVCGQTGISGSTKIGNFTTLAGQVGLAGHLNIGNQVTVAAQSGVMSDIPDGGKWLGAPAQPDREMKRIFIALQRLPELLRRVNDLEKRLGQGPESIR